MDQVIKYLRENYPSFDEASFIKWFTENKVNSAQFNSIEFTFDQILALASCC